MPPLADLRSYLQVALPDSHLTEAKVDPSYEPLLLLRTNHFLAAFAFSNGDVRKSYESIYTSFKQHYAERRGQWDSLDLSFVFCVKPDLPELAQFCSSIETDVYFCRKFVVPLSASVGSSLARLPFIPLTQLTGQSFRPPSAQTFLNQCGVPTVLAKYLVVQRTRGPEAIVEDCINGDFGDPRSLAPPEQSLIAQPDQTAAPITVESLTIENFRAYRRPQTFSLGSDVTVLYGANGFGKTSVFDAFDFATTGDIGRINSRSDQHFLKTATHLDSKPEDSAVSLSFWSNGALRKLTRTVSDRKRAVLDGIPTDRKPLLSELTSGNFPAADRVENFVSLFRATHLFNQEQPELTKDFRDDCRLPSEIVARMLAFEDYVSAVSKATKVREHLDSVIATANSQIRELTEQIADETSELKRLAGTATTGAPSEGIDNELQSLSKKLEELGLSVGSEKADVSVLRGWRASLMGRLAESQSKTERLSVLDREIDEVIASRTESKRLDGLISEGQRVLAEAAQLRIPAESALKLSDQTVFESNREITSAQTRIDLLTWIRDKRPEYDQLIQRERSVTEVMGNATSALAQDRDLEDSTAIELRKTDELRTGWTESLDKACEQLTAVEQFTEAMVVWRSNE